MPYVSACMFVVISACAVTAHAEIRCFPKQLTHQDTLTIEMDVPHGKELAIQGPGGDFYYVFYTRMANSHLVNEPIATNAIFANISGLTVRPQYFMARKWAADANQYELVFKESGAYTVLLGDVLETDAQGVIETCRVLFAAPSHTSDVQ